MEGVMESQDLSSLLSWMCKREVWTILQKLSLLWRAGRLIHENSIHALLVI